MPRTTHIFQNPLEGFKKNILKCKLYTNVAKDNHKNNNWRKPKLQLGFSGIYFSDLVAYLLNMIS